jgi:cyanophycin synthetase
LSGSDALPFDESRRLTGPSPFLAQPGAALETTPGIVVDEAIVENWRWRIATARHWLGWPDGEVFARRHASGASLAFAAPEDQLLCATEVNEWALCCALDVRCLHAPGHPATWDDESARATLVALSKEEALPALAALLDAAAVHSLPALVGEDLLTLGSGQGGRSYPLDALPAPDDIPWSDIHAIPSALVTGSNGKTTTVRLIASMLRAAQHRTGYSCTDGLFVEGATIDAGDYSGPIGARTVLRRPDLDAAVLETARGGLLRRGLALRQANVAVVTNVSADHFGEYGVHSVADLVNVKLAVARALDASGTLVLNADDDGLSNAAESIRERHDAPAIAWFALDHDAPRLIQARAHAQATCGLRAGHLWLTNPDGEEADLGEAAAMPVSLRGRARYNLANAAAASLAASALGVPPGTIAAVLSRFGRDNADNRGRLEHWHIGGVEVWLDYAHNPDGLTKLLDAVLPPDFKGRLGLMLGHAGNRLDADIRDVAITAARYRPARVLLKDIAGYERGRQSGEVANVIRAALLEHGIPESALAFVSSESDATRALLAWAQPGDMLVLPVHGYEARTEIVALLDGLEASPSAAAVR